MRDGKPVAETHMDAAILLGLQHQIERFNEAVGRDTDLKDYTGTIALACLGLSFAPTAVGLARNCRGLGRIFALNATAPVILLLLSIVFLRYPAPARLEQLAIMLVASGGLVAWVSTLIDAATGMPESPEEG
jgi:hypothetical protein